MRSTLFLIILTVMALSLSGQSLSFYADVMVNADQAANRIYAAGEFEKMFESELSNASSLSRSFHELPSLSIQYPQDSSFRTITWQIDEGNGSYVYGGYLQTSDNVVSKLAGKRGRSTHDNDAIINFDQWKGGLVYKILSMDQNPEIYYLLTFRIVNQFTKVKTLEPLMIDAGKATLGQLNHFDIADSGQKQTSRIALLYSIDANASITYESTSDKIIFDNLVVVQGRIPGQGPTAVPDGSYKAYERSNDGSWAYIDKLYTERNTGALDPRAKKKLNNELFKKKKNRK